MYRVITLMALLIAFNLYAQEDHSEHIEGPFDSPQEVTETCLACHEDAGEQIIHERHWKWSVLKYYKNIKTNLKAGKKNIMNNFCIAVPSNSPRCTSCHIGYGWKDNGFDFNDKNNIDCLVCHEQSGTYKKIPTGAGLPAKDVDLVKVAQSVGPTTRKNCGTCHYSGGGGVGVKHGDMDDMLTDPSEDLDIHMGGMDFTCTECHKTEEHHISGASHGSMMHNENHIYCTDCHDDEMHGLEILNKHLGAVACETCHIPEFARGLPTKTYWNWETAGRDDIKPEKDEYGKVTYMKKKGTFEWGKNVIPEYAWYNGSATYKLIGDEIDPSGPVKLNEVNGDIKDATAKIAPFKVMRGRQPYDPKNNLMIVPKLFGKGGFWKTFDWNKAAELGMKEVGIDYSGELAFIETEMYWPINHMVPPAKDALKCTECHGEKATRMDWEALGYPGDPVKTRGRETLGLGK